MKVLHTCISSSWGGLEMYSLQTVEQLNNNGIESELLCFQNSRLYYEALKKKIHVHTSVFKNYFHPAIVFKWSGFLKEHNYDLIHCSASKDLWLIVPALRLAGLKTPLIFTKHMGSYIIKKDLLHRWIYSRVNIATAISSVIAKNLVETTPLIKEKILLLHNGIDTNYFNPSTVDQKVVRNEFKIGEKEILIGMMARFSPGKGHEEFIYSAKELIKKYDNLRFMIIGEPSKGEDKYAAEIKTLASNLDIKNKIIFTGFRKDSPAVLSALDIFVFPSHAEAFGLALVEAMSMAKPSVCSNSDGVLDIAVDNVTSFLFEKKNWKDLSEKMELLIVNENLRNEFGKAARKRAVDMFDLRLYTKNLIDLYEQIIQKNRQMIKGVLYNE